MIVRGMLLGILLISASTIAHGKEDPCPAKMLVEITGTVKFLSTEKPGSVTIHLTDGRAKCLQNVRWVVVENPVKPACKPGAKLVAKVPLEDIIFIDGPDWGDAVSYSCR
jgi:hypothetical protein